MSATVLEIPLIICSVYFYYSVLIVFSEMKPSPKRGWSAVGRPCWSACSCWSHGLFCGLWLWTWYYPLQ